MWAYSVGIEMSDLTMSDNDVSSTPARTRLRGFAIHMAVYFVVMIAGVAVNYVFAPGEWWFALPMVAWGAPLALHAAYAMGLFGSKM
jgi:hypothetical protein